MLPSHLLIRTVAVSAMAGAAFLGSAAISQASPADDAYLAALRGSGLSWNSATQPTLISEAHDVCYNLTWGWTPQRIADNLHARWQGDGVTEAEAATMVNAAHRIYCPGNVCDAPTLCT